jgi:hypothetical protein
MESTTLLWKRISSVRLRATTQEPATEAVLLSRNAQLGRARRAPHVSQALSRTNTSVSYGLAYDGLLPRRRLRRTAVDVASDSLGNGHIGGELSGLDFDFEAFNNGFRWQPARLTKVRRPSRRRSHQHSCSLGTQIRVKVLVGGCARRAATQVLVLGIDSDRGLANRLTQLRNVALLLALKNKAASCAPGIASLFQSYPRLCHCKLFVTCQPNGSCLLELLDTQRHSNLCADS